MNVLRFIHRKIGFKGWLLLAFLIIFGAGWLLARFIPSFQECSNESGGFIPNLFRCLPYGLEIIIVVIFPGILVLTHGSKNLGGDVFLPASIISGLIYFGIGMVIDFLIKLRRLKRGGVN